MTTPSLKLDQGQFSNIDLDFAKKKMTANQVNILREYFANQNPPRVKDIQEFIMLRFHLAYDPKEIAACRRDWGIPTKDRAPNLKPYQVEMLFKHFESSSCVTCRDVEDYYKSQFSCIPHDKTIKKYQKLLDDRCRKLFPDSLVHGLNVTKLDIETDEFDPIQYFWHPNFNWDRV